MSAQETHQSLAQKLASTAYKSPNVINPNTETSGGNFYTEQSLAPPASKTAISSASFRAGVYSSLVGIMLNVAVFAGFGVVPWGIFSALCVGFVFGLFVCKDSSL